MLDDTNARIPARWRSLKAPARRVGRRGPTTRIAEIAIQAQIRVDTADSTFSMSATVNNTTADAFRDLPALNQFEVLSYIILKYTQQLFVHKDLS